MSAPAPSKWLLRLVDLIIGCLFAATIALFKAPSWAVLLGMWIGISWSVLDDCRDALMRPTTPDSGSL